MPPTWIFGRVLVIFFRKVYMLWFCLNMSVIGIRMCLWSVLEINIKKSSITINRLRTRPICNFLFFLSCSTSLKHANCLCYRLISNLLSICSVWGSTVISWESAHGRSSWKKSIVWGWADLWVWFKEEWKNRN